MWRFCLFSLSPHTFFVIRRFDLHVRFFTASSQVPVFYARDVFSCLLFTVFENNLGSRRKKTVSDYFSSFADVDLSQGHVHSFCSFFVYVFCESMPFVTP